MRLGPAVCVALIALHGCTEGDDDACRRLRERLADIEAEAERIEAESFDDVGELQRLQAERGSVSNDLVENDCQ